MPGLPAVFRACLEDVDIDRLRSIWSRVCPRLPRPQSRDEWLVVIHRARTEAASVGLAKRLWSHMWLTERGYASGLPDPLRPPRDQVVPRIVPAVGVAVRALHASRRDLAQAVQKAMGDAAGEMIEAGITDAARISARMWAARDAVLKAA